MKRSIVFAIIIALVTLFITACESDDFQLLTTGEVANFVTALPEQPSYPSNNPYSEEKKELGRLLFWDPVLSGAEDVACATCHHPDFGYGDGLDLSSGVDGVGLGPNRSSGVQIRRNAPTIINTVFNGINNEGNLSHQDAPMFWDNRESSLEGQALGPILSKEEMRGDSIDVNAIMDTVIQRLNSIPEYKLRFASAFGDSSITQDRILQAIATFERGIVALNSPFDLYMRGDENALTTEQIEGLSMFIDAGCADCHSGPMFSDFELHTIGVPDNISPPDSGASGVFNFRTPTLRNLSTTGPYMHNGLHTTLEEVMDFYEDAEDGDQEDINSNLSPGDLDADIRDLDLDDDDFEVIITFLGALNDEDFDKTIPTSVPSGLPAGGNIRM